MMNEFWTTVLSTAGAAACASAIVSGVITSVASIWLQHIYDKKLADHQAKVQKQIDDYQIRFRYWHEEKAKAIKILFNDFVNMYSVLLKLMICAQDYDGSDSAIIERSKLLQEYALSLEQGSTDWMRLTLYLNDKSNQDISSFIKKQRVFSDLYVLCVKNNNMDDVIKKGDNILSEISVKLGDLRKQFRETLLAQNGNIVKDNKNEVKQ